MEDEEFVLLADVNFSLLLILSNVSFVSSPSRDRDYHLKTYKSVIPGSKLVDWLISQVRRSIIHDPIITERASERYRFLYFFLWPITVVTVMVDPSIKDQQMILFEKFISIL